jgi:RNA polymerase sigma factor (TIGR02999 family)
MAGPDKRAADVTRLLEKWRRGDHQALDELLPIVYGELRRIARVQLGRERAYAALRPTELVHEAFIRLVDQRVGWQNRAHFYGIAASFMRRILVDHARRKHAAKRPPLDGAVALEDVDIGTSHNIEALLAIDQALQQLAARSPRQAQIAELKMFAGLEITEIVDVVGVSEATVKRDWAEAKRLLSAALGRG